MIRGVFAVLALLVLASGCSDSRVAANLAVEVAQAKPGAVIRIAPGRHLGPIVIDKAISLVGGDDVVVVAPPSGVGIEIVKAAGVTLSDISIEGGSIGIRVWRSEDVAISGVTVTGAARHGILIENAQATVTDCRVRDMVEQYARGIEVRNSELRDTTVISGCTVTGPVFEGIAARLSHVSFADNTVEGATSVGIAVTEMSAGSVSASRVDGGIGKGILCGDMSVCEILDNTVIGVGDARKGLSTRGHAVVVQYHSVAVVDGLHTSGLAGQQVMTSLGGIVQQER